MAYQVTCQTCGVASASGSEFCTHCGARQMVQAAAAGAAPVGAQYEMTAEMRPAPAFAPTAAPIRVTLAVDQTVFPEFVMRFFAFLIDTVLAGIAVMITYGVMALIVSLFALGGMFGGMHAARGMGPVSEGMGLGVGVAALGAGAFFFVLNLMLVAAVYVGYFVMQETSARQATIGKSLLGMKVTTIDGRRITVLQSLARLLIKDTFSFVLFIGYFMAAFTERKQALHDYVAGTVVVKA